mgnify:CR=1 FL=1
MVVGLGTHHLQLAFLVHYHGPDEGSHDAARHGIVGVDEGTGLGIARLECCIEAGPVEPEEHSTCVRTKKEKFT